MKSFRDFLEKVDTLDTLHDPSIRSYYSRHRVTPQNRKDFELLREIIMITLESGPSARRRLSILLRQLATTTVPEIKPLVNQLGTFTAQDERDAKKLFAPADISRDLGTGEEDEDDIPGEDGAAPDDDTTPEDDELAHDEEEEEKNLSL